ncbi:heat shock protein Hsp20 [Pseudopedobacter saltans DSM 12145]|uniref:Heat shock protein Hsp20 n=1 Tax=Pseudopedobacter saltans (strain ATCC 51119 / DSM 12145 / JCM 21818 / CCUG 39354 / LMG 10337 / NBRC 100064 / NCIMB 13643) TaxID=762903 RepID=F0S9A5_PSESL|nr:Hsp20/alpha crystallin family protein [Pseudopedobacter saltans]ADY52455.1 heat shock protein Hsp20 [Pseudopedobacter saltans DSM 12145]
MANLARQNRGMSPWVDFFNVDNFFDNNWLKSFDKEFPAVNIAENEQNYALEVIAPGFKKEDFNLKVDDDILTISAETKSDTQEDNKKKEYTRREYNFRSFTRSFRLPENVKDNDIKASYSDGVLHLTLPKSEVQVKASKEISIE